MLYAYHLCRLQDKTSTFAGPMDVVKQVVKKEGLLGLYAGMEATFWRWDNCSLSNCNIVDASSW